MNITVLFTTFILFIGTFSNPISREEYYPIFKDGSLTEMESLVTHLEKVNAHNAYLGALKMKLSGQQKGANLKLKTFKAGRSLLEAEINKHPNNIEWRFLRLAVQEHAPKILKYANNLVEDSEYISSNYHTSPLDLQKIIANYSTNSQELNSSKLK